MGKNKHETLDGSFSLLEQETEKQNKIFKIPVLLKFFVKTPILVS